uniref:Uncharacterized protein n=1 Tax=Candidatus Kentrum sp. FW TaxID=2126338 RepID=A0A450TUN8_9GAMM|nr:MAG: hypothetical protein BECKFW1821C_GA0114237_103625 [Candidatus Kentron sp. FW]
MEYGFRCKSNDFQVRKRFDSGKPNRPDEDYCKDLSKTNGNISMQTVTSLPSFRELTSHEAPFDTVLSHHSDDRRLGPQRVPVPLLPSLPSMNKLTNHISRPNPYPSLPPAWPDPQSPWLVSRWHHPASCHLSSRHRNHPAWIPECAWQIKPHRHRG